jgi:hypothetical protein
MKGLCDVFSARYDIEMDLFRCYDLIELVHTAPPQTCWKSLIKTLETN